MTTSSRPLPGRALRPGDLTVLYDADCPVCRRARRWVERHHQLVPIRFVAAGSPAAIARFPRLDVGSTLEDVTVITDTGAVLRGDDAWITVLWAVSKTRATSVRLAQGRHRRLFGRAKGAAELMRRMSGSQPDRPAAPWPAPDPSASARARVGRGS